MLGSSLKSLSQFIDPDSDKVLVLVRLAGGNDGLNTIIGRDQVENLREVRPKIALPDDYILELTTDVGIHGRMQGFQELFKEKLVGVVQAVGYPNHNRSHFRSTDIWQTGADSDEILPSGWFGRYLNRDHPEYPINYPNANFPHPLGMTMGKIINQTCQGRFDNMGITVDNPFSYAFISPGGNPTLPAGTHYKSEVEYIRRIINQNNTYGQAVQDAAIAGNSLVDTYPTTGFGDQLRDIAYMISGGLKTKIYIATLGGFDHHADQVQGGPDQGRHGNLLDQLSTAIKAFVDDLDALGLADRVIGMTYSEFGRQIRENASVGTDHGNAAPMFVFGNCVQGGVLGSNPVIDTEVDRGDGVPFQYDFRDVYGSLLRDWFELDDAIIRDTVAPEFQYLPIFSGCAGVLPVELMSFAATGLDKSIRLEWATASEVGNAGFKVERSQDGRNFHPIGKRAAGPQGEGVNEYRFDDELVEPGILYYYRLRQEDLDGAFEYSYIQTARIRGVGPGGWSVGLPSPNPVRSDSYLPVYTPQDSRAQFEIFNMSGVRVRTGNLVLQMGDNRVDLRSGSLPAGTYAFRLMTEKGESFNRKFIKR